MAIKNKSVNFLPLTDLNDQIASATAPANPEANSLWLDTSVSPPILKSWENKTWVPQRLDISELDPDLAITIETIEATMGNMANDNIIDFTERQVIVDNLLEIIGYVLSTATSTPTTMPTVATLEASKKGNLYSSRANAVSAGIATNTASYIAVATTYNSLSSYLTNMTPIKPWDITTANQSKSVTVVKNSFRQAWLNYYLAVQKLVEDTALKIKENIDKNTEEISSASAGIELLKESIKLYATKTEVKDSLTSYPTKTEMTSAIEIKYNEISLGVKTVEEKTKKVSDDLNNLTIGGRNYLLSSNYLKSYTQVNLVGTAQTDGSVSIAVNTDSTGQPMNIGQMLQDPIKSRVNVATNFKTGDDITFSIWLKGATTQLPPEGYIGAGMGYISAKNNTTYMNPDVYTRYDYTFKYNLTSGDILPHIRFNNQRGTYILGMMAIYKSSVGMEWVPALEDAKLYTAWSNDPNGKDMVRVYPNENLILNTEVIPTVFYRPITGGTTSITSVLQSDGWHRISLRTSGVNSQTEILPIPNRWYTLKSGVTYTQSILVRTDATYNSSLINQFSWFTNEDSHNRQNAKTEYLGNNIYRISGSLTPTKEMNLRLFDSYLTAFQYHTTGTYMDFKYGKLEIGSEATVWTSNPTEDPIKAEMAYIGYSPKDSNDPKDYVWSENPKAKGTFKRWANSANGLVDMTDVYPNENLLQTTTSVSTIVGTGQPNQIDARTNYTLLTTPFNTLWADMKVGDTFTFSCDVNISGTGFAGQFRPQTSTGLWLAIGSYYNVTKAETVRVSFTGTVTQSLIDTATVDKIQTRYDNIPTTVSITVSKPKLERGSVATPYTTNREEDLLLQIPQYVGIGAKDTMNPADFVWSENPRVAELSADIANNSIIEMSKDTVLSAVEKSTIAKEWATIQSDYPLTKAQGTKYGVAVTTLNTTYTALSSYITPLLSNMTVNSDIVPATFQSTFKNYYDAKVAVINGVNDVINKSVDTSKQEAINTSKTYTDAQIKVAKDSINIGVNETSEAVKSITTSISKLVNMFPDPDLKKQTPKPTVESGVTATYDASGLVISNTGATKARAYWGVAPISLTIGKTYTVKAYVNSGGSGDIEIGSAGGENISATTTNSNSFWLEGSIKCTNYTAFSIYVQAGKSFRIRELYVYEGSGVTNQEILNSFEASKAYADARIKVTKEAIDLTVSKKVEQTQVDASILENKKILDTRATNQLPSWYYTNYPKQKVEEFKQLSSIGLSSITSGTYCKLETDVPWIDTTGGKVNQIAFCDVANYQRFSTSDSVWGAWVKIADANDVSNAISTSKTYADAQIKIAKDAIDLGVKEVKETTTKVSDSLNNLKLSQRNLILDSHKDYSNTNYLINQYKLDEEWVAGEQYTFVVKGTLGATTQLFGVWMNGGSSNVGYARDLYSTGIYYFTFTATTPVQEHKRTLNLYNYPNNTTTATVDWVALYKGNKPFDWTPALGDAMLYTAWSNKEDGSVDFTRNYPNENLLVRADEFTEKIIGSSGGIDPYAGNNTSAVLIPVTAGDILYMTQSNYNAQQGFRWRWLDSNKAYIANSRSANVANKQFTVTAPTGASYFQASYSTLGDNKVERGSYSIMTPSPQDDPIKAEMAYIGYSAKDSNDPKDYVWSENPKVKGTFKRWANSSDGKVDFTRTYPNENLITNSKTLTDYSASVWTRKATDIEGFYMLDISTTNNTSWQESRVLLSSEYGSLTGQVTVSFEYKNSVRDLLWTNIGAFNGDSRLKEIENVSVDNNPVYVCTVLPNGWTKAVGVFNVSNLSNVSANAYWLQFKKVSTKSGNISVRKIKVELGSNPNAVYTSSAEEDPLLAIPQYVGIGAKDSDNPADFVWSVSPEYTQALNEVSVKEVRFQLTPDSIYGMVGESSEFIAWQDAMASKPSIDDLMNVQDQLDGLSNADETILASVADLEIANNGVLTTLNTAVREMDGTLNTISDYMFFGKSSLTGTVGLTIGKSDSNMKVNIANDEMGFYDNETKIAWINSQQLNITSAVIQNDIKVGNHLIEKFNDAEQITIVRYMGS